MEEDEPIQAKCEDCEAEEPIQRFADSPAQAEPDLENRLNASQGGGSALPDDVRSFMEPRFGADFSQVRVHTGSEAVQMNQDLNAQAFTHKQDVYYGAGKTPGNNALTAHELTHVVQQDEDIEKKDTNGVLEKSTCFTINGSFIQNKPSKKRAKQKIDLSRLPTQLVVREAVKQLANSKEELEKNTAQLLISGDVAIYCVEDLKPELNPESGNLTLELPNEEKMTLVKSGVGTAKKNLIVVEARGLNAKDKSAVETMKIRILHETSHARNIQPEDQKGDEIAYYKSEFRAFWVSSEFRKVKDLNDRAKKVKADVLSKYKYLRDAYSNPLIGDQMDKHDRPEGNLKNE